MFQIYFSFFSRVLFQIGSSGKETESYRILIAHTPGYNSGHLQPVNLNGRRTELFQAFPIEQSGGLFASKSKD